MMKCFECGGTNEIKKLRAFKYDGIGLNNIVLLNVAVESCDNCDTKTPLLRNVKRLHNSIGLAIALQNVSLSNSDIRFLRRISGLSIEDWSARLGIVPAHYARVEKGERPITNQVDLLARANCVNELYKQNPENIGIAQYIELIFNLRPERNRDFVIAVDAENPKTKAKYLPNDSPLLEEPKTSFVSAKIIPVENIKLARITSGHALSVPANLVYDSELCG